MGAGGGLHVVPDGRGDVERAGVAARERGGREHALPQHVGRADLRRVVPIAVPNELWQGLGLGLGLGFGYTHPHPHPHYRLSIVGMSMVLAPVPPSHGTTPSSSKSGCEP